VSFCTNCGVTGSYFCPRLPWIPTAIAFYSYGLPCSHAMHLHSVLNSAACLICDAHCFKHLSLVRKSPHFIPPTCYIQILFVEFRLLLKYIPEYLSNFYITLLYDCICPWQGMSAMLCPWSAYYSSDLEQALWKLKFFCYWPLWVEQTSTLLARWFDFSIYLQTKCKTHFFHARKLGNNGQWQCVRFEFVCILRCNIKVFVYYNYYYY